MKPAAHAHHSCSSRRGFTLVELIATIVLVGTLGSVVSVVLMTSIDSYSRAATTAQLHTELSVAMDRIDQLLRFIPRSGAGPNISSLSATSITWNTNSSLSLSGTQLLLVESGGASSVLLQDVSSLSIQAYDQSDAALAASLSGASCSSIQRIVVTISLTRRGITETLRTRIFLRCMLSGAA